MAIVLSLDAIHRAHEKLLSKTAAAVVLELADAGKFAVDYVKAHPTFTPRTGHLQAKTDWVPYRGKAIKIQNRAKYATFVEAGTRPHVIRPRMGTNALRFMVRGKVVFAKRVNHPGTRPRKFLYRATVAAGRILNQGLANRLDRIAREF
jgi:hypothetical protein